MRNFLTGLIVLCVIVISIWLQINILNNIPLFGVKANIGIVFVVALSILCGQGVGVSVGISYGLLTDILFGKAFGIYTLLYFLIGFFCGMMSRGFSKENKVAITMITAGTSLVFECISYFIFILVFDYELELGIFLKTTALEVVYNIFLARLLYKALNNLSETINKGKRSYYLL